MAPILRPVNHVCMQHAAVSAVDGWEAERQEMRRMLTLAELSADGVRNDLLELSDELEETEAELDAALTKLTEANRLLQQREARLIEQEAEIRELREERERMRGGVVGRVVPVDPSSIAECAEEAQG